MKASGLGEAHEKLIYYNMSPAERHAYDERLKWNYLIKPA